MAKALFSDKNKAKKDDEQKNRKKQAKKEAKLMAQVDQARKDVRKAEQKATKAQTILQEQQAHLYNLEQDLTRLRQAGQESSVPAQDEVEQIELIEIELVDNTTQDIEEPQTASSLPTEGTNDIDTSATAGSDIASEDTTSTPIEDIPAEQFDEGPGAQVYADISINPAPTEEDLVISSGDGSIPVVTTDENAWPPPQIREELAASIAEEAAQEHQSSSENEQSETATATASNGQNEALAATQEQTATDNGRSAAEENLAISSGDGSIPVFTTDENAWPPPQIREELAEAIIEEVAQEKANNEQSKASEASTEEDAEEEHESEHEESSSRPRRSTRRRTRSNAHQDTNKTGQE
ncbi:MAG: hypothetical protein H0U76_11550 [Ktedonobacteraceae bacterium]|nr:hypothetical protein [Ktedonobacteraceae bacterium]